MKKWTTTAGDEACFNYTKNPFRPGTHLACALGGIFVVLSPKEGERFKYQPAALASEEEAEWYNTNHPIRIPDDYGDENWGEWHEGAWYPY